MNGNEGRLVFFTESQLKDVCKEAAKAGVQEYLGSKVQEQAENGDRYLHNTFLLLQNYKRFKAYITEAVKSLSDIDGVTMSREQVEALRIFGLRTDDTQVRSIQKSVVTMSILMGHVDRMLEVYKATCAASASPVKRRRWEVIEKLYLSDENKTCAEIAAEMHLDPRAIRRDAKEARGELKTLFFGIEALLDDLRWPKHGQ